MDVQIGMACKNQALCDQIAAIIGYSFLGLFSWFVIYLVVKAIQNRK